MCKRSRLLFIATILAALFGLVGTGAYVLNPGGNIGVQAEPRRVVMKVGATLPLSGRLAFAGEDIRRGILLAVRNLSNEHLGFDVIFEDNQHEGRQAATTAHKLLDEDKVDAIISLWDMADVVAPIAERKHIPHLAIRWDPQIAHDYSSTFTIESTYFSYIDSLIELLKSANVHNVGVLTEEGQGWLLAGEYLKRKAPEAGISIVSDQHFSGDQAIYGEIVLKSLAEKPEMVVILSNPPHTEMLIKRLREMNPVQRFTGYFEYIENPQIVSGIPFVAQFSAEPWFEKEFVEMYGERFKARAPQGYDALGLIAAAQKEGSAKLTGRMLVGAISRVRDLKGASGALSLSPDKHIESACVWKEARGSDFVLLK